MLGSVFGMSTAFGQLSGGQLVGVLDAVLDALVAERPGVATDREQLDLLLASLRVGARLHAWQARLAATIDKGDVAWREHRTSTATWLADAARLTRREAGRIIATGEALTRFDVLGDAAVRGEVLPPQRTP